MMPRRPGSPARSVSGRGSRPLVSPIIPASSNEANEAAGNFSRIERPGGSGASTQPVKRPKASGEQATRRDLGGRMPRSRSRHIYNFSIDNPDTLWYQ
jgi:hypothetical protein